jgi:hypothetical protein
VELFFNTVVSHCQQIVGILVKLLVYSHAWYEIFHLCKMVEVKVYNKDMTVVSNCIWMDGGGRTRLSIQAVTRAVVRELHHLSNMHGLLVLASKCSIFSPQSSDGADW